MNIAPLGTVSSTHGSLEDMSYHNSVGKHWAVNLENAGWRSKDENVEFEPHLF